MQLYFCVEVSIPVCTSTHECMITQTQQKMKKIIAVFSFILVLMVSQNLLAQHHPHHRFHHEKHQTLVDMVMDDLELTEEQQQQLAELRKKLKEERKALKEEIHANEDISREEMHKKMMGQREAQFAQVMNILNEEQQAILKAKKEEVEAEMKQRRVRMKKHRAEMKDLRSEMKTYKEANIQPKVAAQRAKLETVLSEEDKATIAELRPVFKELKQRHERRFGGKQAPKERPSKEEIEERKAEHKAKMETLKPHKETLKALAEKYDADIEKLYTALDADHELWKKEMKAIHKKYQSEKTEKAEGRKFRHKKEMRPHHGKREMKKEHDGTFSMNKGHFLLLEPAEVTELAVSQNALTKISVYPNPASNLNTINYEVKQAGQVRIELRNEGGEVLRVLTDEFKNTGNFAIEVDLAELRDGVYYYTITDGNGVISKKVIVSK